MHKKIIITILLISSQLSFAQNKELLERLSTLKNSGITFYNIDGIDFTSQDTNYEFTKKNLKKLYRKYKIKKRHLKNTDSILDLENKKVIITEKLKNDLVYTTVNYFVKNHKKKISVFWFEYYVNVQPEFERKMIQLILDDKIPQNCYNSLKTDTINFAGRELNLGGVCHWMNINNIQCPYYGQMNWSVHKTKISADNSIQNQLQITKIKKGVKVLNEKTVDIVFEGIETKAIKVILKLKGGYSVLASMTGGENLTIYYVSAKVRGNYISCVLSFWNNDKINSSGLPPLLEKVMSLPLK